MADPDTPPSPMPEWLVQELAHADVARARGQLEQATEPQARAARFDARKKLIVIRLDSGALFAFPPRLAQGLADARPADLAEIEVSPAGTGLYWPRLDVDLSVQGLLAGVRTHFHG